MKRHHLSILFIVFLLISCGKSDLKKNQLLHKGNLAVNEKMYREAIRYYSGAIQIDSTFTKAYNNLGVTYYEMGDYENAIKNFSGAIKTDSTFPDPYIHRSNTFVALGSYTPALLDLLEFEKIYPDSSVTHFLKGLVYFHMKNYKNSIASFQKALELDTTNAEIYINLATAFYYNGDRRQADWYVDKGLKVNAGIVEGYNLKALISIDLDSLEKASYYIAKALKLDPGNAYCLNNRGLLKMLNKDMDGALEDINNSIITDPDNPWAYRNKGMYFLKTNRPEKAFEMFNKTYSIDPDTPELNFYFGEYYRLTGDHKKACSYYHISDSLNEEKGAAAAHRYCTEIP